MTSRTLVLVATDKEFEVTSTLYNRTTDKPTAPFRVLSLCTGIAGDVAAFLLADIAHELIAVAEFDSVASAVLAQKFPNTPNLGDLTQVSHWRNYHGQIDILVAGFPCQPFSIAGKRRGHNDRRDLTAEILRVIGEIEPRWIVIENVPQFATARDGVAFRRFQRRLEQAGYAFDHRIIDAAELLPQRRKRLFILAHRGGAKSGPSQILADATCGRGRSEAGTEISLPAAGAAAGGASILHPARLSTLMASGSGMNRAGMRGHELGLLIVQDFPGIGLVVRRPTPLEALRAQGFPDDWLDGLEVEGRSLTDLEKYELIGNSWPVPVMAGILSGIARSERSNTH